MDILPIGQRNIWPQLAPATQLGFVLYGGTAIALRLGHRISADFDFFTDYPLDKVRLRQSFPFLQQSTTLQDTPDSLTVLATDTINLTPIKLSFFGTITFGRVGIPDRTSNSPVQIASLLDLMATKVKVILQRIEAKDYRDIAAMLRAGVNLAEGLAAAQLIYGATFQPSESLKAMVYFHGGDLDMLSTDDKDVLIQSASSVHELPTIHLASQHLLDI